MRLTKHHGLGNDFLIAIDPPRALSGADAISWCHRRRGIGADGLISASRAPAGASGDGRHWSMAMWNADGSRPEVSGNGLRCLGQALAAHTGAPTFDVHTDAGPRAVTMIKGGAEALLRVDMGPAAADGALSTRWDELGVAVQRQAAVRIGNPHLVALVDRVDAHDIAAVGRAVEADSPDGVNVHLIQQVDRETVELRVWERGVGPTEACGSGACAAAWAARTWGLVSPTVRVRMPGGDVSVEVVEGDQPSVHLTGPAVFVAAVDVEDPLDASPVRGAAATRPSR